MVQNRPTPIWRLDPRPISYESAVQVDEDDAGDVRVDPNVEKSADEWAPISPEPRTLPDCVAFVDGVQRVEMRVIGDAEGRVTYGALTSLAVGATFYRSGAGACEPGLPERILALAGGGTDTGEMRVTVGRATLDFQPRNSHMPGFPGMYDALTSARRECETRLGEELVGSGCPLVIVDGRLNFQSSRSSMAMGLIKTMQKQYLQGTALGVLTQLTTGSRSPIFVIERDRSVYSWYLRLADRNPVDHPWAGLVRLETLDALGINGAIALADVVTQHLPRFASTPQWDARAPQNLYPIAALESVLRRRLGDHELIRRGIQTHFHRLMSAA
jgi:hypothetical protein